MRTRNRGAGVSRPAAIPLLPGSRVSMVRDKVRIRFHKGGELRLVSHHDLMRCFERMLRRAELPFRSSEGFNPRPRLVFALSLALGIVGREEVAELELAEVLPVEALHSRLARQAPPGLQILSVRRVDPKAGAQVRQATYRVPLPPRDLRDAADRAASLLAATECWIERTRPHSRRLNVRAYLYDLRLTPEALEMDLIVSPGGTARPEEVLDLLGLADVLEAGAVLERTRLVLHDEPSEEVVSGQQTTDH